MISPRMLALNLATTSGVAAPLRRLLRGRATVFMLHRFADPERGVPGQCPLRLRRVLAYLRRERYPLVTLSELFRRLAAGEPLQGAVAFTLDDGYYDQASLAAPVFAEFDCPSTVFVTTGFLDGQVWFWWDQIEHVFATAGRRDVEVELGGVPLRYRWSDERGRAAVQADFTERCKRVPDEEKHRAIRSLAAAAEAGIPLHAPEHYAPMTWDELRACERTGMTFGPHTVTHPILSRATDAQCRREVAGSWRRLREEAARPVPVFCYPNGGRDDFGEREIAEIRGAGLVGAVVGEPGYAGVRSFTHGADGPFRVRRFGLPEGLPHMIQYVAGVERLKQILRREAA